MQTMLINPPSAFPAQSSIQPNSQNAALLQRLKSAHLLTLSPDSPGGLLIVKQFYVDFAGPGAAVGGELDRDCTAVYAVGVVRCQMPLTLRDRQESIYTRMSYTERLAEILDVAVPVRRSSLMMEQLANWLPGNLALTIPAELVAGLVGVLPTTVRLVWQTHKAMSGDASTLLVDFHREETHHVV